MNKRKLLVLNGLLVISAFLIAACSVPSTGKAQDTVMQQDKTVQNQPQDNQAMEDESMDSQSMQDESMVEGVDQNDSMQEGAMMQASALVEFTLVTGSSGGKLVYFGQGGEIDGQVNPVLSASAGDTVRITLINGDGKLHDIFLPDLGAKTEASSTLGNEAVIEFTAPDSGDFVYYCTTGGHRAAGMEGTFIVQ